MSKTINQDNLNATLRMLDKMGEATLEQLKLTDPQQAERMEQLSALLSSEDFCKEFLACTEKPAAVKLFADNGMEMTEDDIAVLAAQIHAMAQKLVENDGELSEEDLEQIAGGGLFAWIAGIGAALSGGMTGAMFGAMFGSVIPGIGTAIGAAIGGIIGAVGSGVTVGIIADK